jgi:hypothetical protein
LPSRASPLLFGYRGSDPVDVAALEQLLLRVALLADDLPEAAELELNPVIVAASGTSVLGATLTLCWRPGSTPDPPATGLGSRCRGRPALSTRDRQSNRGGEGYGPLWAWPATTRVRIRRACPTGPSCQTWCEMTSTGVSQGAR